MSALRQLFSQITPVGVLWQPVFGFRRFVPVLNAAGLALIVAYWWSIPADGFDIRSFHSVRDLDALYQNAWHEEESFVYAPVIAQLLHPLSLLPYELFAKLWQGLNLACLVWLLGPAYGAVSLAFLPVTSEIETGEIHLMLAVALVIAMRNTPAIWAAVLLTKVTPGVLLAWFAVRREWRYLGVALAATAIIAVLSWLVWPTAWDEWFELLAESGPRGWPFYTLTDTPVWFRLPIALVLTVLAAWRKRIVALPLIFLYAQPAVWFTGVVLAAAIPRLVTLRQTLGSPRVAAGPAQWQAAGSGGPQARASADSSE